MISDNTRIAVKDNTDIVRLAERMGLKLQHEGALFKCCCPFHAEDTPSFKINPTKQIWRCYGRYNEGGDVIDLYMRLANVDFPKAVQELAQEAGIELEDFTPEERDVCAKRHTAARQYHWLNEMAAQYYASCLREQSNAPALEYLHGRKFTPATIERARLGYAPVDGRLRAYIRARLDDRGAGDRWPAVQTAMHECGLLGKNDEGYEYERLRGRIMFPIADRSGHIVGFGGRVIEDKPGQAKYKNTSETAIFQKRSLLYGLDAALADIRTAKRILIVEGYVDTLASHQVGIGYTVATLGVSLTDSHLPELRRLGASIILSFDNDEAGHKAAEAAARLLIPAELQFAVCIAEGGKDLGEVLLASPAAAETFRARLNALQDGFTWLLQRLLERAGDNDIQRVQVAQDLAHLAARGGSQLLAKARIDRIAKLSGLPKSDLICALKASTERGEQSCDTGTTQKGIRGEPVDAPPRAPLPPDNAEAFTDYTDPEHPFNDIGTARRLHVLFGARLRYCFALGQWAYFNGTFWSLKCDGQVKSCMISLSDTVSRFAELTNNKDLREYALKSLGANNKHTAALEVYKGLAGVGCDPEDFDRDLMALPVRNGIIDLATGTLRPHSPAEFITNVIDIEYDQRAECPRWQKFIEFIACGRRDLQEYLHRAVGYTLTGSTSEQCLFFLYGGGKNGKSVFMEVLRHLLGYLAQKAPIEMITRKDFASSLQPEVAALRGKRFASCSEIGSRMQLDEAKTKDITGGDAISCRTLYSDQFTFKPQFKLWLHGNHKPSIKDCDYGIWRRMRLIPFDAIVSDTETDPDLLQKLLQELPGILAWAVRGCFEWQLSGLDEPTVIKDATKAYQDESNKTGRFLAECCATNEWITTSLTQLYEAYEAWCKEGGELALSKRKFKVEFEQAAMLAGVKLDYKRNNTGMVYKGVLLQSSSPTKDEF